MKKTVQVLIQNGKLIDDERNLRYSALLATTSKRRFPKRNVPDGAAVETDFANWEGEATGNDILSGIAAEFRRIQTADSKDNRSKRKDTPYFNL